MAQSYRTLRSAAVLNSTGVSAGIYGSGSLVPVITVGTDGRITAVATSSVSGGGGGGASVVVSDTAPVSPSSGNIWFDSTKLNTYIYYNDGDSSQWVNATSVNVGSIILPTQTGNTGKFLTTNGSSISWGTVSSVTTTAVSDQSNTSTGYLALPKGTTAQRPASPDYGAMRYNTTTGFAEVYTSGGWTIMGVAPPTISTVSPGTYNGESGTLFTINGTNFTSDATVKFVDVNNTEYSAALVTFVNSTQLTATTPQDFTVAQEPLDVRVIQMSGTVTKLDCIDTGGIPGWSTAAGQIGGTIYKNGSVSTSVVATDPDSGATISYSLLSGALPSGLSLNANTGAITGTAPAVASDTTYNFTLRVTDNAGNIADRAFSMVILQGAPGAPTIGTATTSASLSVQVTFTAPGNTGGGAITSYTATSSPGNITGTGASSPVTVTGLTDGTTYTFTVTATNSYGTSVASGASNSVTAYAVDTYFSYAPLLLETRASSTRSTVALDSSTNAFTVTRNGTPSTGWTSPYQTVGYWSNYFGATGQYLSVPYSSAFNLTGDFTVEFWINCGNLPSTTASAAQSYERIFSFGTYNAANSFGLEIASNDTARVRQFLSWYNTTSYSLSSNNAISPGIWYHIALVRSGTTITFYLNGTSTGTITGASAAVNTSQAFYIATLQGYEADASAAFNGYISNFRIVKGVAVYTGAFTAPTTPLAATQSAGTNIAAITGTATSLLTCQSNRFIDNSTNNFAITVTGTPRVTSDYYPSTFAAPAASPGAGLFNGTSEYLTLATSLSGLALGSSDFTVEAWVYRVSGTATASIFTGQADYATAAGSSYLFVISSSTTSDLYIGATGYGITSPNPTLNTWTHLAWARTSGTFSSYLNGTRVGTRSDLGAGSVNVGSITYLPSIGASSYPANYLNGYISNFRFIKGSGGYNATSATITVPTAPLTAITNTQLLVNFADSNYTSATNAGQNNTFIDDSNYAWPITRNGTATQGSRTPYWPNGQWSNYFNGSTDYLTVASNTGLAFGTNNFTIEFWVWFNTTSSSPFIYSSQTSGSYTIAPDIYISGGKFYVQVSSTNPINGTGPTTVTVGRWYHVALVKNSGTTTLYVNGASEASFADSNTYVIGANRPVIGVYGYNPTVYYLNGYVSNLRVVNGTAVYTGAFTPPTTPLAPVTNTSLLTCQSNRFLDTNTQLTPKVITPSGTPTVQAFQPFSPAASYTTAAYGGSLYNGGASNYLSVPHNVALNLVSGDFTIETWFYCTALTANEQQILNKDGVNSVSYTQYLIGISSTGTLVVSLGNGNGLSPTATDYGASTTVPLNSWNHVAVVRTGSTIKVFFNGAQVNSTAQVTAMSDGGKALLIGFFASGVTGSYFNGYISNTRIVKGTAVYTAAFTPPTAPLTAITNTSLLMNFTNAGIYDSAVQNDITTVGDAQASTTQSKWSPSSIKFDGTGDYLNVSTGSPQSLTFGTGDFTIEFWVYFTSNTGYQTLYDGRVAPGVYPLLYLNNGVINYYVNTTTAITSVQPSTGVWYFMSLRRSSGTTQFFINGAQSGSNYTDANNYLAPPTSGARIGANYTNADFLFGYVQDFRVTKGVARTISTPTAAFPTR